MNLDPSSDSADSGLPVEGPLLTADMPGVGGRLKEQPEDFFVAEIPAYEPCGEGEHLYLWIEKRDLSAEALKTHIARTLGIRGDDVGMAGLKDRRAVTQQYVSVPSRCAEAVPQLEREDVRVMHTALHTNKLRTGHLKGNRFEIAVRDVVEDAARRAAEIAQRIQMAGCPNYFGRQRFGHDGQTLAMGVRLLRGEMTERDIPRASRRFLLRLALSAAQSELFNLALAQRMADGLLHRVLKGDVLQKCDTGGLFVADDPVVEQQRFAAGSTELTGPIFGGKMKLPGGEVADREGAILEAVGLTLEDFKRFKKLLPGTRRAYLMRPADLEVEQHAGDLKFRFTLPRGSYATVLLREFLEPTV